MMVKVSPVPGSNTLVVTLPKKQAGFIDLLITSTDITPPALKIIAPQPNLVTRLDTINIVGTMTDPSPSEVSVNGLVRTVSADTFRFNYGLPPVDGPHLITFTAVDAAGNRVDSTRTVRVDRTPPTLTISAPPNGFITNQTTIGIAFTMNDASFVSLYLNGQPILNCTSTCSFTVFPPLVEGPNSFGLMAVDAAGNESTTQMLMGTRDTQRPTLTVTAPADSSTVSTPTVTVTGTASDAMLKDVKVNGVAVTLNNGAFSKSVDLVVGVNTIVVIATDSATNADTVRRTVTRSTLPPDPATVATPISPTVSTNVATSTAFLYTGANPIQTGAAPGTINPVRAAVLRGKVISNSGQPVTGVTIAIKGHPEFGQTLSRIDGMFDLVVNGGGALVLQYSKTGFLALERGLTVPWQDFLVLDDAVLTALDPQVTAIDFTAPVQVARGSLVTDADGTRRTTLLFKQGTTAQMVMPDGSTSPLSQMHVRATEYTVGPGGPSSMPAELPPTSGYTYAVEASVDEAQSAGAATVTFSHAVPLYVENFLQVKPGTKVPFAYYDRPKSAWIPLDDGRVVSIVAEQNGRAQVDLDGDGSAESTTTLTAFGIDDAEQVQLATLYDPGQSLWRFAVDHFSPFDGNFPAGGPDAKSPNVPDPSSEGGGGGNKETTDDPSECEGSLIECENQVLGERLGLVGTGLTLNYRSNRVPGRTSGYQTVITLTGDSVPIGLVNVIWEVDVAGRRFLDSLAPAPNLKHTFAWDGRDAYGRVLLGAQQAVVRVSYVYANQFYLIPTVDARTFGLTCRGDTTAFMSACILKDIAGNPVPSRGRSSVTQEFRIVLGLMGAYSGLGGWTLSAHHAYDPIEQILYLGTGEKQAAQVAGAVKTIARAGQDWPDVEFRSDASGIAVGSDGTIYVADEGNRVVRRIRGNGSIDVFAGNGTTQVIDNVPATATGTQPSYLRVGPDGSVYIAEFSDNRIRRVNPHDTITTVVGNGQCTNNALPANGSVATAIELCSPEKFAVGPDGTLYVANDDVLLRVGPDGLVYRVAGIGTRDGTACFYQDFGFNELCQDEILATRARIGLVGGVALGPDGSLYIGDIYANVIRRVTPDGLIHRFVGTGQSGFSGDGGPAIDALIREPSDLFVSPSGALYFNDDGKRIRKVTSGGTIVTAVGNGEFCDTVDDPTCSEGAPALQVPMSSVNDIGLAPDGSLYYTEAFGDWVRRLLPAMPQFSNADFVVAASDGSALFGFDNLGRHLTTRDARTGALLTSFAYDSAGRLVSLTDGDTNTVTIERDGMGNATAIVAPRGQRSTVSINADGYLASITDPASQSVAFSYGIGGLLDTLVDARNKLYRFTYDGLGRLIRDDDPAGGFTTLTRAASGFKITRSRALGHSWSYEVQRSSDGAETRIVTKPSGVVHRDSLGADGSLRTTAPDSTVTDWTFGPDPRFGMQAPVLKTISVRLPSGLTSTARSRRSVSLAVPSDPLSLVSEVDSVQSSGNWSVRVYNAANHQITQTTAEGRQIIARIDSQGRPVSWHVNGLDSIVYAYDPRGRLQEARMGGRVWSYSYDTRGRLLSETDPLGRHDSLFYDDADRVTRYVMKNGRSISYAYDANGNLTTVTPPSRPSHGFQYTPINLTSVYDPPGIPGSKPTHYFYNLERQLDSIVRPDSVTVRFASDSGGRPSSVGFDRGTLRFSYSPTSGKLIALTSPNGDSVKYSYDGSLPIDQAWVGTINGHVSVTYDSGFRVASQSVSGTSAFSFGYDRDGLLTSAGAMRIGRSESNGLILADTLGPLQSSYAYSARGELNGYHVTLASTPIYGTGYSRDSLGRVIQLFDTTQGTPMRWSFVYDSVGRIAADSLNGANLHSYTYDASGNRLSFTSANGTINYTHDDQDRLLSAGTTSYTYGSNGELKTKTIPGVGTTSYTYDALGNLMTVQLPSGPTIDYVIDAQNRRIGRKVNGSLTRAWLYQNQLNPIAELDGAGNVGSLFVYGTRANVPDYMIRGGITYRMISDHLGSVRLVVDISSGVVVQRIDYDEWGNVTQNTNAGFQPFGFAGGMYDEQTGLVRFGARDYDPAVGRWTAKDPILFSGGDIGLYTYSGNDAVNQSDPTGLLFGGLINAGECAGESAARYWAEQAIKDKGFNRAVDNVMGWLASLWTPETSDNTFATLSAFWGLTEGMIGKEGMRLVEFNNWKNAAGEWVAGDPFSVKPTPGSGLWHWHWGEGPGLQGWHLPYELGNWLRNFNGILGRGQAWGDLINMGAIGAAGLAKLLHKLGLGDLNCGCDP